MPTQPSRSNPSPQDDQLSLVLLRDLGETVRTVQFSVSNIHNDMNRHSTGLEALKIEFAGLKGNVDSLIKLVRDGNGQPSLMTRVAIVESKLQERDRGEQESAEERRHRLSNDWAIWIAVISAVATLTGAAISLVK